MNTGESPGAVQPRGTVRERIVEVVAFHGVMGHGLTRDDGIWATGVGPAVFRYLQPGSRKWHMRLDLTCAGLAAVRQFCELNVFPEWIADGRHGEMKYMEARDEAGELKRAALARVAPWARSVIVCAINYNTAQPYSTQTDRRKPRVDFALRLEPRGLPRCRAAAIARGGIEAS